MQPLESSGIEWCEFLLNTKSSHFWESVETLELMECDTVTVLKIISEISMPNLKSLRLEVFKPADRVDEFIYSKVKIYSVRLFSLTYSEDVFKDKSLGILFKCFPNMTECKVLSWRSVFSEIPIASLPKGLRSLDIFTYGSIEYLELLNLSTTFPLLTKLRLQVESCGFPRNNLNQKVYFSNLTDLNINQRVLQSVTFVLPQLRKLKIFFLDNSSLDYLKEFKKLKSIQSNFAEKGTVQEIIDSNFLFSFLNLNRFHCMEYMDPDIEFNFDSVPDVISKSLIYFNVNDCKKTDYYCKNENVKRLQEKRMPFLCKYGGGRIEWPHTHDDGW